MVKIMFTSRVMVNKMLTETKTWLVFVFSADDSKKLVTAWTKHLSATERFSWVNMITRQVASFFSSTIWILYVGTFHFHILRLSEFTSVRSPLYFMFWSVKPTVLHTKDDNFKPVIGLQTRNLCYA